MKSYLLQQHGLTWRTGQVEISQSRQDRCCTSLSHEASGTVRCTEQTVVVIGGRREAGELLLMGWQAPVTPDEHIPDSCCTAWCQQSAVLCSEKFVKRHLLLEILTKNTHTRKLWVVIVIFIILTMVMVKGGCTYVQTHKIIYIVQFFEHQLLLQ